MPHILIIEARFYDDLADELAAGAMGALAKAGATYDRVSVPGALEIPAALAMALDAMEAGGTHYDGFVALGTVIRGETTHYDIVAGESARALMDIAVAESLAIGNGILTVENDEMSFGLDDLLPLADAVPIVLDLHHHWVRSQGEYLRPDDPRIATVIGSWRGVRPVAHISVSREDLLADWPADSLPDYAALAARGLGLNDFGIFSMLLAQVQLLTGLAAFQSNHAIVRYGVEHLRTGNRRAFQALIKAGTLLDLGAAIFAMVATFLLVPLISDYLGWGRDITRSAQLISVLPLTTAITPSMRPDTRPTTGW